MPDVPIRATQPQRSPHRTPRAWLYSVITCLATVPLLLLAVVPSVAAAHPTEVAIPDSVTYSTPLPTLHYRSTLASSIFSDLLGSDANGNVYAPDSTSNKVYMYNSGGTLTQTFGTGIGNGNGQFSTPEGVAVSGNDVFIVDDGNHRIQEFDRTTGNYLNQFGSEQLSEPQGIALASNGQLYVVDTGDNDVARFDTSGNFLGNFGSAGSGDGQFNLVDGVAASPLGFIYVADGGNQRVQQFDLSGAFIRAWNTWGTTHLSAPVGVAVDRANNVWITDAGYEAVYSFNSTGTPISRYFGRYLQSFSMSGNGLLNTPEGIAVVGIPGAGPSVYISDISQTNVYRFDVALQAISHNYQAQWGSPGSGNGQFGFPVGVALDSDQNAYVVDSSNDRIEKFDRYGNYLTQWGSHGSGDGQFDNPYGIAIDPSNHLYVTDTNNNRVEVFDTSGTFIEVFDGTPDHQLSSPTGIATDGTSVYVVSFGTDLVEKFDASGTFQTQWGGSGSGSGQFDGPVGIALDVNRQQVYVADTSNNRIEWFDTSGTFIAAFDGTPSTSALAFPEGVFTDQRGDLYVTDGSSRVVQFDLNGNYVGSFGSAGTGDGQFADVNGGAVDPQSGQLYIADASNHRVQRFGSPSPQNDTIGIWRPSAKTFYLRNENSTGPSDIAVFVPYAQSTDLPVVGDWNGDGVDTIGLYRPSTAHFFLQDANVQESAPDYTFTLGIAGDTPIAGDWNGDGTTGAGIFRPSNGILYLKNSLSTGPADYNLVLGVPGDKGIAGDWNGDGQDSPGVYRPSNERFYVTNKVTDGVVTSDHSAVLGINGDAPFTGDWIAQGSSGIGVFRPSNGITYEKNAISTGPADNSFVYGVAGDVPVAGQWVASGAVPMAAPHAMTPPASRTSSHPATPGIPAHTPARPETGTHRQ